MRIDEAQLQGILDDFTGRGEECGCQLAIYREGKKILDICSGHTTSERNEKVTPDTLFPIYSCGKGILATAIHMLAERGELSYDWKVSDYWKEFGCNGKENVLLWHILSHRSGLHVMPPDLPPATMGDWDTMVRIMEEMTPVWEPGTKTGYQGLSIAWLAGEAVYRMTGRRLKDVILEEIFKPLGIDKDFYFGTTPEIDLRCADVDISGMGDHPSWSKIHFDCMECRRGFIPCFNGVATAAALAKHYSALITETDGVRFLTDETLKKATTYSRWEGHPAAPGEWSTFGLGYVLKGEGLKEIFGHGGALGSEGLVHLPTRTAIAFTKNKDRVDHPNHVIRDRISDSLGISRRFW
ncbi:MAG: beta-lactamase family protein [Lentisphaeria bacterium]|nr:beta-lactamase family protein [Lentisphaeria bacterium]